MAENVPKTCILCQSFYFSAGESAWSDETPGQDWHCGCDKGHFYMRGEDVTFKEYRANLLLAEQCPDFAWSPDLKRSEPPAGEGDAPRSEDSR